VVGSTIVTSTKEVLVSDAVVVVNTVLIGVGMDKHPQADEIWEHGNCWTPVGAAEHASGVEVGDGVVLVVDEVVEEELEDDEVVEDLLVEDEMDEDLLVEDEVDEDLLVEDEVVEDLLVEDEVVEERVELELDDFVVLFETVGVELEDVLETLVEVALLDIVDFLDVHDVVLVLVEEVFLEVHEVVLTLLVEVFFDDVQELVLWVLVDVFLLVVA
jgi:hypothetical protein